MGKNVGGFDKALRIILGVVLVIAGIFAPLDGRLRIAAFVLAGVAFFTGIAGF